MQNQRCYRRFLVICLLLSIIACLAFYPYTQNIGSFFEYATKLNEKSSHILNSPQGEHNDKWIVITSISYPTPDVRYLATLSGWKVLIVGDTKTPENWSYPDVTFLSVKDQTKLGYRITSLLPHNSYSRKNIGYLYAIAHGAKFIYDTDDDNRPLGTAFEGFDLDTTVKGLVYPKNNNTTILFNPYRHFTKENIWPRGFPLEDIGMPYDAHRWICSGGNVLTPSIQQGLVNGDPDVDAIYRLTNLKATQVPKILFDSTAPPLILPHGIFAPFNSQNTLFHYKALWALVLPMTTTFRVCDIWRGYWAQVLLWLLRGNLGFYPPNAIQKRNPHSYLKDFMEESQMYNDAGRLIKFLSQWVCLQEKFFECVRQLSNDMVQNKFWKVEDYQLVDYWLKDLVGLGYQEPPMEMYRTIPCAENSSLVYSLFYPAYHKTEIHFQNIYFNETASIPKTSNQSKAKNITSNKSKLFKMQNFQTSFSETLLVIVFNFPNFEVIPILESMYRSTFHQILYCGYLSEAAAKNHNIGNILKEVTFVNSTNTNGYFGYECFLFAFEMGFRVEGFLVMSDDVMLNVWNLYGLDKHKIWFFDGPGAFREIPLNQTTPFPWIWWGGSMGRTAVNASVTELRLSSTSHSLEATINEFFRKLNSNVKNESNIPFSYSDIYYIPHQVAYLAHMFGSVFRQNKVFLELAVPMIIAGLSRREERINFLGRFLSYSERGMQVTWFNESSYFLHPFKLSQVNKSALFATQLDQYFGNLSIFLDLKHLAKKTTS